MRTRSPSPNADSAHKSAGFFQDSKYILVWLLVGAIGLVVANGIMVSRSPDTKTFRDLLSEEGPTLIREISLAILISSLLALFIDGRLRKREQDELLARVSKELEALRAQSEALSIEIRRAEKDQLLEAVTTELAALRAQSVALSEDIGARLRQNLIELQRNLVENALSNLFGDDIFREINNCLTSIPFVREEFEMRIRFAPPAPLSANPDRIQVIVEVITRIRCVAIGGADFADFLPRFFITPTPLEEVREFHYCSIGGKQYSLSIDNASGNANVREGREAVRFDHGEKREIRYKYALLKRRTDSEVFYTFLPSSNLEVWVDKPRADSVVAFDPMHRRNISPTRTEHGPLSVLWQFPVPLIPFQGFELRWRDLDCQPVILV